MPVAADGRAAGRPSVSAPGWVPIPFPLPGRVPTGLFEVQRAEEHLVAADPRQSVGGHATATRITNANEYIEVVAVSRDGKWLFYDSNLAGGSDIFRLSLGGGEPERLTTNVADDFYPSPSPDGKEVVFHSWRSGSRDLS
jgi:hypothetical protein